MIVFLAQKEGKVADQDVIKREVEILRANGRARDAELLETQLLAKADKDKESQTKRYKRGTL